MKGMSTISKTQPVYVGNSVCADGIVQLLNCFYLGSVHFFLINRPNKAFVTLKLHRDIRLNSNWS